MNSNNKGKNGERELATILREYMIKIPTERKWYRCPYCGKKLLIYEDTAKCSGVYLNCRECKREINIKI